MTIKQRVHDLIDQAAEAYGDAPALSAGENTLSYGQLRDEVQRVGRSLRGIGVQRGERVAVYLDKRVETVTTIFGTSVAGGTFVPLNPLLRARQVAYILRDCDVRVLVTTAARYQQVLEELDDLKTLTDVVLVGAPADVDASDMPDSCTIRSWSEFLQSRCDSREPLDVIDLDMAAILYTSGSTGSPKGVVLSHRNLIAGAESVSHYLGNTAHDVLLAALPLSFDAGFSQLTTGFNVGAHVVLLNYLLPRDVVRLCAQHRVTGLTCVPPLWIQIAEQEWPPEVAAGLRYFANTGGRMPKATLERLRSIFTEARPFLMYGLTEAFRSTYLDPDQVDSRPDSIGKAIPNAQILVVRPDGSECDPGEEGELVHRGALVALGYWNDPERTAARFRPAPGREPGLCTAEPAVWSGDSVIRDDEGYLYFVGRKDEMIKTSGYRVSPTEIEEVAYDTGAVRDAVAIGIDDPVIAQAIVLIVTAKPGMSLDEVELHSALKRQLPLYMVPRRIIVRDEIPRSPNGKFDRNQLRSELAS